MRLLKRKIQATEARLLARASQQKRTQPRRLNNSNHKTSSKSNRPNQILKHRKRTRILGRIALVTKNLVKNFGRAISNFSSSELAEPYVDRFRKSDHVELKGFEEFCLIQRDAI